MQSWLSENLWAVWLGVALVLGVVEAATADLVFLMLVGGALVGSGAALVHVGPVAQVIAAVVTAVALLGLVRPVAKRRLERGVGAHAMGVDRYLGRTVVVTEDVSEHRGFARLDGDTWSARVGPDDPVIPAGHEAEVVDVRGAALLLTPVAPVRDVITREGERP